MRSPLIVRWRDALADSPLASSVKLTGLVLATYWQADGSCPAWGNVRMPGAGPSRATLARRTSLDWRTVVAALRTLEREGWLIRTHTGTGRGHTHRWVAALPGEPAPVIEAAPNPRAYLNEVRR